MTDRPHLSPKLHLTATHGFALHDSRQPSFRREWHEHDCGMLLWPRMGRLRTIWDAPADASEAAASRYAATLVRGAAVLLPASTSHLTASEHRQQQHGELYLPPDRMPARRYGAIRLDGPTVAMLEALLAPALSTASASWLVRAVVEQIVTSPPLALPDEPASIAHRMIGRFTQALECDRPLPSIDAVASELGVAVRQLQRACQIEFGTTPVAIRRRLLAAHARALIAAGRPAATVSVQLGFASSGHLHRLLREVPA
ncbi:helix-turn-helix domain-containing protein [Cupriavidus sp.]|uniref:helix-turn-helix domain-containing protein n=2 Tax=unclassified Cupriavidus TaxID=2640874 RepID=UPI0025C5D9DF|nr:helix-turn-helix domain-containing protein [Cupriavidus sp.]MCA3188355.1 helix-turn-helix transcriptional regulator [Cupriavidus sp.]MCA3193758.1 helix-turn-helix transcriptional regulator [Cupriavidus sp.]MCA3196269.1 helix-turn-helix transcriptional regulator [Cupriavidus sp.]MCA3203790.1 helix-turn-helix transcriptional regulator [Cupriavidus sp.]MCA3207834.1 helix-turn-helix transcriptional regulator [Cupriavidus sp.]